MENKSNEKRTYRDVSKDVINNKTLEEVQISGNYGDENVLITRYLNKFPLNNDPDVVAMKISLIDITNSTNLSRHKRFINLDELSRIIVTIPNIDKRIEAGDPDVVNEIARCNGKINLFSFASKYCCYHNCNLYKHDDYSILDNVLKEYLPRYFSDIKKSQIKNWVKAFKYREYNDYLTQQLDELGITIANRKR